VKRLLIIETIPDRHEAFEGEALRQALELMKKAWDGRICRHLKIDVKLAFTKRSFLSSLEEECDFLHISAHGRRKDSAHVLVIGKGVEVTPEEVAKKSLKAASIFVSACHAGHRDLANAFFSNGRAGFYLAPVSEPPFDEAFLVALQFHRGAFLEEFAKKGINKGKERFNSRTQKYIAELKSVKKPYRLFEFP
jgi:hypothetical protein